MTKFLTLTAKGNGRVVLFNVQHIQLIGTHDNEDTVIRINGKDYPVKQTIKQIVDMLK